MDETCPICKGCGKDPYNPEIVCDFCYGDGSVPVCVPEKQNLK